MTPEEIDRLARLKLSADDDGVIFGIESFATAIEAATLCEVEKNLIHERSLYLSKWKREAITACIERVRALATKEGACS